MSMADRDGFIWYDGKLVPWRDATTHVLTHSLHYGLSVFEGVRAYDGELGTAIFRLQDHTRRLFNSAHIYQIPMPFDPDTVNEAQRQVVRENQLKSCYLRPWSSTAPRRWACRQGRPRARGHRRLALGRLPGRGSAVPGHPRQGFSFARQHVNVTMPRAKVATTYANSILANTEALQDGYDEALLLDTDGFVAEGSGENLFLVKDGVLCEPEIASALTGITRSTIHALAADLGLRVVTKRLTRDDVYIADEAFFTGTAAEVTRSARSTTARSAQAAGARHRSPAEGLFRRGAWPQPEVPSLAEQNLIRAALLISRQAASLPPTQPSHGSFISGIPMTAASPAAVSSAQHEVIEVGAEDLPVFCPGPKAPLWSMHPASSSTWPAPVRPAAPTVAPNTV